MNNRTEIEWAPRVSLSKIRELYIREARGTCDDELIEEVGFGLFARCQSILEFTEAVNGQVKCKRCARDGKATILERKTKKTSRGASLHGLWLAGALAGISERVRKGRWTITCRACYGGISTLCDEVSAVPQPGR